MLERPQLACRPCGCASRAAPAPAAARRIPRSRPRTSTRTAPRRRGSGAGSCRRRSTSPAPRPRSPRTSAGAAPQERQKADQWPSTFRRSSRSQSAALPTRSRSYRHGYDSLASHRRTEECSGDRARCRADRLVAGCEGAGPRPRGPARDLPQHARHPRRRRARAHPLPPGKDPGLVLHRPRQRGVGRRRRDRDGARRRRHAAAPRHGRAHHARRRAVADLRAVHGPRRTARRTDATATCTWPTSASGCSRWSATCRRCCRSSVGCALAFRIREEKRVAVAWSGEGAIGARRRARGHELRRRAQAAGRLHLRQQPVGVLDADAPRVRRRAPRRPRAGVRLRRRRRRRHRRARRLPRGEARDREGARRRRADADRVPDAAHGGPRGARRRVLRPEGAVRALGRARPDRALPHAGCASRST